MTDETKRYKYNYDKRVNETRVLKTNEVVLLDRSPFAANVNSSLKSDKLPYNKLVPRVDGPIRIVTIQDHTLTSDENGLPEIVSVDRAAPHPPTKSNVIVGKE